MKASTESGTKDKIIDSAIELFSEKGFYETSVRELAEMSGIRVSSLYNHFAGKEQILEAILDYYQSELTKVRIPDERLDLIIAQYPPEEILIRGFMRIIETTASQRMNKIIKILLIELYRNPKVREFYQQWYFNENRTSVMKLFGKMQEKGLIREVDPELLSSMYNAMINFYYHEYFLAKSGGQDTSGLEAKVREHLRMFIGLLK